MNPMAGTFFGKEKVCFLIILLCLFLTGCASSEISRESAADVDAGIQNAKNLVSGDGDFADAYQNTSQATKGAIIGGAVGAVTGGIASSGIGAFQGALIGVVLGASYGTYIDTYTSLQDRLENRGVTIVVLGDQILIVLRSARIFYPLTSTIKAQAYSTLKMVSTYVNQYTKMLVRVTGYTANTGSMGADLALSKQQAENVAKFLLASGIDARLLYATGCGGMNLVEENSPAWDGNDNYRIYTVLTRQEPYYYANTVDGKILDMPPAIHG
jgi:outer membrane protein OmpA-like peptidoglycan-associated protein